MKKVDPGCPVMVAWKIPAGEREKAVNRGCAEVVPLVRGLKVVFLEYPAKPENPGIELLSKALFFPNVRLPSTIFPALKVFLGITIDVSVTRSSRGTHGSGAWK